MGDRTYSQATIHRHYYNQLEQEFGGKDKLQEASDVEEIEVDKETVTFKSYEANYGHQEKLEDLLKERKIEYDKSWASGGDYAAGSEYARIIEGEYSSYEIYDDQQTVADMLKELLQETDPVKLKEIMEKKLLEHEPFEVKPLKASNSIDFIKNA